MVRRACFLSLVIMSASLCGAQVKSGAAMILLQATLQQSLTISALPDAQTFNTFVESPSQAKPEFPVSLRANWVRGPGRVSISVFSGSDAAAKQFEAGDSPEIQFESRDLQMPANGKDQVLIVRAQVI